MYGSYHEESIYNLVPREYVAPEKVPMYKPSRPSNMKIPNSTFGCKGSTRPLGAGIVEKKEGAYFGKPKPEYGLAQVGLDSKALSPGRDSLEVRASKYEAEDRRPPVPRKEEKPIMGITTSKNYVTANAVEAILQVPKHTGTTELNYMKKEDFGKVPDYLGQVKEEIKRENEMIERYVKEQMGEIEQPPEHYDAMPDHERLALIDALKSKWAAVNKDYQKITHLVLLDTTGQVRRKEQFENELTRLEKDIEKLSRCNTLLVRP